MTHDLKYIVKRIIISVGIILVLSFLRQIFIMDVLALEIENEFTEPIYYIPKDTTLHKCDYFITNYELNNQGFGYCGVQYIPQIQLHYYSNMLPTLDLQYPYYIEATDNPSYTYNGNNAWYNPINYHTLYNLVGYNITLYRYGFDIEAGQDYSLMVEIIKSNTMDYSYDTLEELSYFSINARDNYNGNYDISEYISNIDLEYVKGKNTKYGEMLDNPYYSNNSYIVINFHVEENVDIVSNNNLMFSNISFYFNKYNEIDGIKYLQNNKALFNTESTGNFKHRIAFIHGGKIEISGICDELNGSCYNGIEYDGELDVITDKDHDLIQNYETCEPLDIPCHLRNIFSGINNLIVRIGNAVKGFFENITRALKNLFIPNFNSMNQTLQELKNTLQNKLGFLWQSEQYFETLINKFLELNEGNVEIQIPEIRVPNFNFVIIQSQTWYLSSYFQEGTLKTFYDTYKMLISGVFIFLLIEHARRRLGTILNMGDFYENGVVREEK